MSAPETPPANGKQAGTAARPFSIRLTDEERRLLLGRAGKLPLGAYVRNLILDEHSRTIRRDARRSPQPVQDHEALARVLAALGRSGIAPNLGQLAKAVSIGALDVTPETAHAIGEACKTIAAMRSDLMRALGVQERGQP